MGRLILGLTNPRSDLAWTRLHLTGHESLLLQPHIAASLEPTLLGAEAEQDSVDFGICSQAQGR